MLNRAYPHVHVAVEDEKFLARVLHDMIAEVIYQKRNVGGMAVPGLGRKGHGVVPLVGKEHLEATPGLACQRTIHPQQGVVAHISVADEIPGGDATNLGRRMVRRHNA